MQLLMLNIQPLLMIMAYKSLILRADALIMKKKYPVFQGGSSAFDIKTPGMHTGSKLCAVAAATRSVIGDGSA